MDRVILVHALESVESPTELLQDVWRVLTPGGRMILVVPNRRGVWARRDATPFGHGQPYSRSQLARLMRATQFSPEGWTEALYMPPVENRLLLQTASAWERMGTGLSLPFAGLHVVDATKQLYRPVTVRRVRRAARLAPGPRAGAGPLPRLNGCRPLSRRKRPCRASCSPSPPCSPS